MLCRKRLTFSNRFRVFAWTSKYHSKTFPVNADFFIYEGKTLDFRKHPDTSRGLNLVFESLSLRFVVPKALYNLTENASFVVQCLNFSSLSRLQQAIDRFQQLLRG